MTWFQMYLFTRLDGIHVALMIGCVILGLLILFAPPIIDMADFDVRNWAEEKAKKARLLKKAEAILISLFVVFGGIKNCYSNPERNGGNHRCSCDCE